MSEPGGWTTPHGWGPPGQQPATGTAGSAPQPASGAPSDGPPPAYGERPTTAGTAAHAPQPGWGYLPPPPPKPGVVPLRPLGLGELLDGAVGIIRRYPRPALGLAAIVAVVSMLAQVLLQVTAFRPFLDLDESALAAGDTAALEDAIGGAAVGGLLGGGLALLASAVLAGAITAVVGKAVLGQPFSFRDALAAVRPVGRRLIGLSLLVGLITGLVFLVPMALGVGIIVAAGGVGALAGMPLVLAGLVLAVYVYVRLSLAPSALVLERTGIRASLRRSSVLVKGDWWRVFGILLLTVVIAVFVSTVIQTPFSVIGSGGFGALFDPEADLLALRPLLLTAIGGAVASTLVSPFMTGVTALLYVDRRMRAEGLDVSLAAAAAAPPQVGAAGP